MVNVVVLGRSGIFFGVKYLSDGVCGMTFFELDRFSKMNLGVASRFAVLKIEDDEDQEKPTVLNQKPSTAKKNNTNKKKKSDKPSQGKKKKGNPVVSDKQWEDWKSLDEKKVFESYEEDLQQAILQSKIDYEQKKTDDVENKVNVSKKKKKKDSKPTLSLDEFNQMSSRQINHLTDGNDKNATQLAAAAKKDSEFFDNVQKDTEEIISREHRKDMAKDRATFIADNAVSLQIQEELAKKDAIIEELEKNVKQLKDKLGTVKERNKRLCNILAECEVKEKAQILIHNQQLLQVKDELSNQVTELHAALEQEKSKASKTR